MTTQNLQVTTPTDREIVMTRVFDAPRVLVFEAFTLATAYRILYTIVGGYITARLAPHAPVRHAVILGLVGLVPGVAGVVVALAKPELGPLWYSIAIAVTGVPCAWLGGVLHRMKH